MRAARPPRSRRGSSRPARRRRGRRPRRAAWRRRQSARKVGSQRSATWAASSAVSAATSAIRSGRAAPRSSVVADGVAAELGLHLLRQRQRRERLEHAASLRGASRIARSSSRRPCTCAARDSGHSGEEAAAPAATPAASEVRARPPRPHRGSRRTRRRARAARARPEAAAPPQRHCPPSRRLRREAAAELVDERASRAVRPRRRSAASRSASTTGPERGVRLGACDDLVEPGACGRQLLRGPHPGLGRGRQGRESAASRSSSWSASNQSHRL